MPWAGETTLMVSRSGSRSRARPRRRSGPDRAVCAPHAPGPGRVDMYSSDVEARFVPPIRRVVTHFVPTAGVCAVVGAVHVPVYHAFLPFAEPARVGGVSEDLSAGARFGTRIHQRHVSVPVTRAA